MSNHITRCPWRDNHVDGPGKLPLICSIIGAKGVSMILNDGGFALRLQYGQGTVGDRFTRDELDAIKQAKPAIVAWLRSRPLIYRVPDDVISLDGPPDAAMKQEIAARIGIQWRTPGITEWLADQGAHYALKYKGWTNDECFRAGMRDLDNWQQGEEL